MVSQARPDPFLFFLFFLGGGGSVLESQTTNFRCCFYLCMYIN